MAFNWETFKTRTGTAVVFVLVMLVGLLDRFEIWDPGRFEKVKASDAVMAQEAFKLME